MRKAATAQNEEELAKKEFLQGKDLSTQDRIGRPDCPNLNDRNDQIEFMQIDCDYYTEKPPANQIRLESKCKVPSLTNFFSVFR